MAWNPELEYDFSGLPLSETLSGQAIAYFAWRGGGIEYEIMDFDISDGYDCTDTNLRGRRRELKRMGKKVPPLAKGSMKGVPLVVLFGPETGPERAIKSLRKMADLIEKRGLVTGRGKDGYFQKEYVKGTEPPYDLSGNRIRTAAAGRKPAKPERRPPSRK